MDTDRNLLFGVLALQADLLDAAGFAEACAAWASRKDIPLGDLLVERGWLTPADQQAVEHLLRAKLNRHGSPQASLAAVAGPEVRQALSALEDPEVRRSLASLTDVPPDLHPTINYPLPSRQRYVLAHLHARGGIGQIWLAHDPQIGRDVALKELRPERAGHEPSTARFLQEARVTGRLEHPGIVPLYELGHRPEDGQPFYVMRFVKGHTLAQACGDYHRERQAGRGRPLGLRELLAAFLGVCNAVAYAHARGVVHRDLKGQNVVLGDFGEVIVLDWGLAKILGTADGEATALAGAGNTNEGTQQGEVLGTPGYMAPEQAVGRPDLVDARTDVYALGAILYEVLTGQPAFTGQDTDEVLRRSVQEPPRPPCQLVRATPPALQAVCLKALAKDPAARYPTAAALADEVRRWLADEPVAAYRESWAARARRWLGRHRTLVTAAAAALLVAVLSLGTATALLAGANRDIREARDLAQRQRDLAEAHFRLARETVEEYCAKVGEDKRLKEKDLADLRKQLLGAAVKFFERLTERRAEDPLPQADLGRAYRQLAYLVGSTGDKNKAIESARRGVAVLGPLAARQPADPRLAADLGEACVVLGNLYTATGQSTQAREQLERAARVLEEALRKHPRSEGVRKWLAKSHHALGVYLEVTLHRLDEAIGAYRRSGALYQELAAAFPRDTEYQAMVGNSHGNVAAAFFGKGDHRAAVSWYRRAIAVLEVAHKQDPKVLRAWEGLSNCKHGLGGTYSAMGRHEEAVGQLTLALSEAQALADAHRSVTHYQQNVARAHHNLSAAYLGMGRRDMAAKHSAASVKFKKELVVRHPEVPDFEADLCRGLHTLALLGTDPEEGERLLGEGRKRLTALVRRHREHLQYQVDLARSHILLGELCKARDPDRASAAYREAIRRFTDLTARQGDVAAHRQGLWQGHHLLAHVQLGQGKRDEAAASLRAAVKALMPLADKNPQNSAWAVLLSRDYHQLGLLALKGGSREDAVAAFQAGLIRQKRVVASSPKDTRAGVFLAQLHADLAQAYPDDDRADKQYAAAVDSLWAAAERKQAETRILTDLTIAYRDWSNMLVRARRYSRAAEILTQSLPVHDRLVAAEPARAEHQVDRVIVQQTLGEMYYLEGQHDRAGEAFRQVLARDREVPAPARAGAEYQLYVANAAQILGVLSHRTWKKPAAAAVFYRQAIARIEKLAQADPRSVRVCGLFATAHRNLGAVYEEGGALDDAAAAYRRCIETLSRLDPRAPEVTKLTEELGHNLGILARSYKRAGRADRAAEIYRQEEQMQEQMVAAHPGVSAYAVTLAGMYCDHGSLVRDRGSPREALALFERAVRLLDPVRRRDPKDSRAARFLRNTHWGRARAYEGLGEHRQALADWDEAVRQAEGIARPKLRLLRVHCLARVGEYARAVAEADEVIGAVKRSGAALYDAARAHAQIADAAVRDAKLPQPERAKFGEGCARRAVALLEQARAAGYFADRGAAERLREDAALNGLRERADFRKLLAGLSESER
jgi:serine/threonine-protein kinase